jgi:hypothetical protein
MATVFIGRFFNGDLVVLELDFQIEFFAIGFIKLEMVHIMPESTSEVFFPPFDVGRVVVVSAII